jgi:hypothetical protein
MKQYNEFVKSMDANENTYPDVKDSIVNEVATRDLSQRLFPPLNQQLQN